MKIGWTLTLRPQDKAFLMTRCVQLVKWSFVLSITRCGFGDLCPHQDFIHFSQLHQRERELLENHRQNVNIMLEKLREDKRLQDLLAGMRFLQAEDKDTEAILDDPEFYVSIDCDIIYTRSAEGRRVLQKARKYAFSAINMRASKRLSKWQ